MDAGAGAGEVCTCQGKAGAQKVAAAGRGRPGTAERVALGLRRSRGAGHPQQSSVDHSPGRARDPRGARRERTRRPMERRGQARRCAERCPRAVSTGARRDFSP